MAWEGFAIVSDGRPPLVLFDATSVPADRGGVGRYVDGLLGALDGMESNLVVVAQRSDLERYTRLLPSAVVVAAPSAIAHRSLWSPRTGTEPSASQPVDLLDWPSTDSPARSRVPDNEH